MPTYSYKALDKGGREIKGSIEATGEEAVVERLRSMGYYVTQVSRSRTNVGQVDIMDLPIVRGIQKVISRGKVKLKHISAFSRQLATLIGAGLPLLRSLQILQEQVEDKNLKEAVIGITESVEGGSTLSEAMAKYPKIFNRLYVNMIKAGEIGGALEQVLDRLALFQEKAQAVRSKVKGAMWYPLVVITIACVATSIILIFVVPKFADMFTGLGSELPWLTQKLVDLSDNLVIYWYYPLLVIVGIVVLLKLTAKTSQGRYILDRIKLRLPVFGGILQKSAIARFARTFGTLLDTGVPILQTLLIVKDTSGNEVIARAMVDIHASIRDGDTVSEPMKNFSIFPPLVVHMIAVGEETGALDKMLIKVAEAYEREVDDAVDGLAKLIEPLLIVVLGGIIGTVVVALYLPIFSISDAMGKK
ncbi:MAG TPA: type II secretion system F family protein [bacterium]|nr:type II secretion system F family protein [Candidatus Omnitrophota bacterium]HOJ61271.1 type II secretion system F family protein [bacterium]HOL93128.1 type II secretion system F family protein [bacterium]HPP01450.1 type II secretion system F family protein [bacterium]HXK92687.1 type II secretion system F family protein [bacterium]